MTGMVIKVQCEIRLGSLSKVWFETIEWIAFSAVNLFIHTHTTFFCLTTSYPAISDFNCDKESPPFILYHRNLQISPLLHTRRRSVG